MRSFSPRTLLAASLLSALPLAGAYAHPGPLDDVAPPVMHGPRLATVLDQVQGVDDGIADARRADKIDAGQARRLEMRAERVARMAQRDAAEDHGLLPMTRYHRILRRLDHVDEQLRVDDGDAYLNL